MNKKVLPLGSDRVRNQLARIVVAARGRGELRMGAEPFTPYGAGYPRGPITDDGSWTPRTGDVYIVSFNAGKSRARLSLLVIAVDRPAGTVTALVSSGRRDPEDLGSGKYVSVTNRSDRKVKLRFTSHFAADTMGVFSIAELAAVACYGGRVGPQTLRSVRDLFPKDAY